MTATVTDNYDLPNIAPQKYNIVLDSRVINDNCYRYQFYDSVYNRLKFAKIYSPFSHLKSGIIFKGENDIVKNNKVIFQLVQNYSKIRCVFLQNADEKAKITTQLYRDVNGKFVKEKQSDNTNRGWAINPSLTFLAHSYKHYIIIMEYKGGLMVNIKLLKMASNVYLMDKLNRLSKIKIMSKSKEMNLFSLVELLKKKKITLSLQL